MSMSEELSREEVGAVRSIQGSTDFVENRGPVSAAYGPVPINGYVPESAAGLADARLVPLATPTVPVPEVAAAEEPVPMPSLRESPDIATLPYVTQEPNSIEGIICARFDDCDYWIAVAVCESSLSPQAIGYAGAYVGLFQIWLGHGYGYDWLTDPYNNTLAAWELSKEGTVTTPWPYCQ